MYIHNTQTKQDDQTDFDAQFEVQIPKNHGRDNSQKQIGGGVESVRIIGEIDH
jgi:hypothetical protein